MKKRGKKRRGLGGLPRASFHEKLPRVRGILSRFVWFTDEIRTSGGDEQNLQEEDQELQGEIQDCKKKTKTPRRRSRTSRRTSRRRSKVLGGPRLEQAEDQGCKDENRALGGDE
ncbi:MAG: hypothetical protein ACUVT5_06515, partial [Candidatus Bathyarchaeales archaeon]